MTAKKKTGITAKKTTNSKKFASANIWHNFHFLSFLALLLLLVSVIVLALSLRQDEVDPGSNYGAALSAADQAAAEFDWQAEVNHLLQAAELVASTDSVDEALLQQRIGDTYIKLSQYQDAANHYIIALDVLGEDRADTALYSQLDRQATYAIQEKLADQKFEAQLQQDVDGLPDIQ